MRSPTALFLRPLLLALALLKASACAPFGEDPGSEAVVDGSRCAPCETSARRDAGGREPANVRDYERQRSRPGETGSDAGGHTLADAATPTVDAATPLVDAGSEHLDGGRAPVDGGSAPCSSTAGGACGDEDPCAACPDAGALVDSGRVDADAPSDAGPPPPPACDETRTRYPSDRTHSPLTCAVTDHLREIAAREPGRDEHVFMKVGDSISAGHEFMSCFETETFSLDATGHGHLASVRDWFLAGEVLSTTPYARASESTLASRTADWALRETPPPIELELAATNARYALVMFGTNDMGYGGYNASAAYKFPWMYENIVELVDWIAARGVVPVMYSIPPYNGQYLELRQLLPSWNVVLRAVAEGRQLPFVDYHREMLALPNLGLRSDGVHPSADYSGLCDFDDETGLIWGYNLRNLLTLQALDRVWQVTQPSPLREQWDNAGAPALVGDGSLSTPRRMDRLPFAEMIDLRQSSNTSLVDYAACATALAGAERVYRVDLSAPTPMRVMALHAPAVDVDIVWLSGPAEASCQAADDVMLRGTFPAGTHYFVVDAATAASEGEVVILAAPCDAADVRCASAP